MLASMSQTFLKFEKVGFLLPLSAEQEDEMPKDCTIAIVEETTALKNYEFAAAEKKEIDAISASIESKAQRIDELTVSIVQMKKTDTGFLSQLIPQGNG